jgi:oligopeptide/dipeptide ABC transporter ATP-binding protein
MGGGAVGGGVAGAVARASDLRKVFRLKRGRDLVAVAGVSLEIHKGEVLGLVGESGSGKSTVGRCFMRLLSPDGGKLQWHDSATTMGMVFQEPRESFNRQFRIWQAIADPVQASGMRLGDELAQRVRDAAESVGLTPSDLLGGVAEASDETLQRASVARALVRDPELLVLDEPTTSLDPDARAGVLELIRRVRSDRSMAILLISHDLLAVRSVTDRLAIMYLGKIVEQGPTATLFANPQHPYTRALLESALELDPALPPPPVELKGEIPSPLDRPPGCPLEPRCPVAVPACSQAEPALGPVAPGHDVACIRVGEFVSDPSLRMPAERDQVDR